MGMFVSLKIDEKLCEAMQTGCQRCIDICPVDVFRLQDGKIVTVFDNEDECTFCNMCVEQCPKAAVKVVKLY
jgi:NAD-dependent dihydropyrimidine dehydrogenase PreA subunit